MFIKNRPLITKVMIDFLMIVFSFILCQKVVFATERNLNIDFNWKFFLGDETKAISPGFNDDGWRTLNLPHDFSIEGKYDEHAPSGWHGAYLPTGIGWYRKDLSLKPEWKGKRVILKFDGVYLNSDVWVNGQHVGHRPNGYVSFEYDITNEVHRKGRLIKDTVIAVRVDHSMAPTGRWYTGSGIYRHVWLDVVDQTHVPTDGIFVRTDSVNFRNNNAVVLVDTEVTGLNVSKKSNEKVSLVHSLVDKNKKTVAKISHNVSSDKKVTKSKFEINNAKLWSTDDPYLYTLKTEIIKNGKTVDTVLTNVGIRTIDYNVTQGFLLNNKEIELKGMSFHHDGGPVGSAVPDDMWRRRLVQLKEMGMNALRPAHTPFSPIFYHLADEMGFVIMNEAFDGWEDEKALFDYGLHFEQWWETDLTSIIKRDRNHPSVVIWSIGNEVEEKTPETQKKLVDLVKSLDNTRPVTQGRGYMLGHDDISGFNGHGEYKGYLEDYHKKHPTKTLVGTEITHTMQTRGIYRTKSSYRAKDNPAPWEMHDPEGIWNRIKDQVNMVPDLTQEEVFKNESPRYSSSYDNEIVRMSIRDEIKMANRLPYLLGTFRWTAFDYLGEALSGWPTRAGNFGVIDLAGFEKDAYYLYQSQWSDKPMVHMLPHWTHPGKEGVEIPVVVYTNLDEAELYLDGKSLGRKKMTNDMQIVWLVPYKAGELKVVARKGNIVKTQTIKTAGKPKTVLLSADKTTLSANQTDVAHITVDVVDVNGNFVPRADNRLTIKVLGPAKIIGTDSGDILDLTNSRANDKKAFNGKLMVLVQATDVAGDIKVEISGEGILPQTLKLLSK
ncbi:glycoside hydrolase family 2 protein [Pseudocolwellia agarivorans]|uniref:glycoside hydrolase family 2 protein n=1 Tax=Pseudocolwellia agarivorans TaxID=1911682 RepID=UPI000985219B|nr:glycoside hydrolase family 2 [Pseudocolwellia agarivorans]